MSEKPTGGDGPDRQRLTVPEAATVLGVTVDAVRGRIRRGKLESEHDKDGKVYVFIEAPEADRPGPSPTVEEPAEASQGPSTDQAALVESLQDQVSFLRTELERRGEEADRYQRIVAGLAQANANLSERVRELEPPRDEPQAPETVSEEPQRAEEARDRPEGSQEAAERRSWWRRFFGFE